MKRTKAPDPPLTRSDQLRAAVVGLLSLPIGFFMYGFWRANCVGFTAGGTFGGVIAIAVVASLLFGPACGFGYVFHRLGRAPIALACGAAVVVPALWAASDPEFHWDSNPEFLILFVAASVLLAGFFARSSWHAVAHAGAVFVLSAALAAAAAETHFLIDESRFADEVDRQGADQAYDRARAKPWKHFGLVYVPGRGTHATD